MRMHFKATEWNKELQLKTQRAKHLTK